MIEDQHRRITIEREEKGSYVARNERGGELRFGQPGDERFTPVELLLVAIAGCGATDVDFITAKRAEPVVFSVVSEADKVRDEGGNRLENITVTFQVAFPADPDGDAARSVLRDAIRKSHDRLCTVSRTVQLATPVTFVDAEAGTP